MAVELSDVERKQLGQRIQRARTTKFGTKSAAYQAAKVNATTWDRIEEGLKVRNDRLSAAVKTLWPESEGDWQRIDEASHPTLGDLIETAESVKYIEVEVGELRRRVQALESRLDTLEGPPADQDRSGCEPEANRKREGVTAAGTNEQSSNDSQLPVPPVIVDGEPGVVRDDLPAESQSPTHE